MKKKKLISTALILSLIVSYIILPIDTKAKTIKEFEEEVAKYTAELQAKKDKVAKNDAEVAQIKKKIADIENQITKAEQEIESLQAEIDKSNKEIEKKTAESKKIMEYYQISNGENAYLEYAFGATNITDMIYRMSIVEQLTDYNDKVMKELDVLIKKNQSQQQELTKKKASLKDLQKELKSEQEKIEADSSSIRETMPSVEVQIKEAQANVNYFKKLGCGSTEDILACQYRIEQSRRSSSSGGGSSGSVPSTNGFYRPMQNGYIVRGFSWNNRTASGSHMGYDLSSNNKSIEVYPISNGVVHAIYTDGCTSGSWCRNMGYSCNGNAKIVVIKHNYNGRYIYSAYVHLSRYGNISQGMVVTKDTVIGYMGTTGCSTGPHLHIEMANCHWQNKGGCTYGDYTRSLINPSSIVTFPSRWNNR